MVVQMRDRMVDHPKLRRGEAPFKQITARHELPGTPGPELARPRCAAAEKEIAQDVHSQFHRQVSSASQNVHWCRDVLRLVGHEHPGETAPPPLPSWAERQRGLQDDLGYARQGRMTVRRPVPSADGRRLLDVTFQARP
jgi:hypothetical protein